MNGWRQQAWTSNLGFGGEGTERGWRGQVKTIPKCEALSMWDGEGPLEKERLKMKREQALAVRKGGHGDTGINQFWRRTCLTE